MEGLFASALHRGRHRTVPLQPWEHGPMAMIFGSGMFVPWGPGAVAPSVSAWLAQDGGQVQPEAEADHQDSGGGVGLFDLASGLPPGEEDARARAKAVTRWAALAKEFAGRVPPY